VQASAKVTAVYFSELFQLQVKLPRQKFTDTKPGIKRLSAALVNIGELFPCAIYIKHYFYKNDMLKKFTDVHLT